MLCLSIYQAPVSLAGALEEYLDDPNFEQNRIEYKNAKTASERNGKNTASKTKPSESEGVRSSSLAQQKPAPASTSTEPSVPPEAKSSTQDNNIIDFFASIEGPSSPQSPR